MRGHAFGLDVSGAFRAPGLWANGASAPPRALRLELASPDALTAAEPIERLLTHRFGEGGPLMTLDRCQLGCLLRVEGWGAYYLSHDGSRVRVAPPSAAAWRWQRLLTAQVLPLAALARGLEVLHAAAVAVGDRVVAVAGDSRAGKSTLAAHLVLGGASFVTDDVLALERDGEGLLAHPGPALMNLRPDAVAALGELERLGTLVGADGAGLRLELRREARALPLGAVYLLERSDAEGTTLEEVAPGPPLLLGLCFHASLRLPGRLENRFEVCSRLARVPMFRVHVPSGTEPRALAAELHGHAKALDA